MKKFVNGEIYHIFNKSIANFKILNSVSSYFRFIAILHYYNSVNLTLSYSDYLRKNKEYLFDNLLYPGVNGVLKFIAYCLMPDHYHLIVKVLNEKYVYQYMNNIGNSYTRYFNTKFKRKGPLWQSAYKDVRIKDNEQFIHVTRYVHINPTTANLVDNPEDWKFSSYCDYILNTKVLGKIITEISITNSAQYRRFTESNIDYQKKLKFIKKLIIE